MTTIPPSAMGLICILTAGSIQAHTATVSIDALIPGRGNMPRRQAIFLREIDRGLYDNAIGNRAHDHSLRPSKGSAQWNGPRDDANGSDAGFPRRGDTSDNVSLQSLVQGRAAIGGVHPETSEGATESSSSRPAIVPIEPPEKDFFAKRLDFQGIPIKAPKEVVDEALYAAHDRLTMMMAHLPNVPVNLAAAGAELHIIGRDQVTTDLPEWRHDKGQPIAEYNGLTRDQRTRGMGGLLASCGEENLLRLEKDRYRGRDICVHEFSHNILSYGVPREIRRQFEAQRQRSLKAGLWVKSYAGSNTDEFFAELAMWYFGTHGDLHMEGRPPANGPEGLKTYDPEAYALVDDFWSGRIPIPKLERNRNRRGQ